ncbi:MAG: hypothetical protein P4L56_31740, partial [Candidatus Sulfopaludibacter sp.]|nr:hypothetical protein [Candidatus Sulfopaludibacter sp.]
KSEAREKRNRLEKLAFRAFAWMASHPRIYALAAPLGVALMPPRLRERFALTEPHAHSFRQLWSRR